MKLRTARKIISTDQPRHRRGTVIAAKIKFYRVNGKKDRRWFRWLESRVGKMGMLELRFNAGISLAAKKHGLEKP